MCPKCGESFFIDVDLDALKASADAEALKGSFSGELFSLVGHVTRVTNSKVE